MQSLLVKYLKTLNDDNRKKFYGVLKQLGANSIEDFIKNVKLDDFLTVVQKEYAK